MCSDLWIMQSVPCVNLNRNSNKNSNRILPSTNEETIYIRTYIQSFVRNSQYRHGRLNKLFSKRSCDEIVMSHWNNRQFQTSQFGHVISMCSRCIIFSIHLIHFRTTEPALITV